MRGRERHPFEFPAAAFLFLFFFPSMSQPLKVSPQLEIKALTILNAKNPLDTPDFSPIDYFNRLFPNGEKKKSV